MAKETRKSSLFAGKKQVKRARRADWIIPRTEEESESEKLSLIYEGTVLNELPTVLAGGKSATTQEVDPITQALTLRPSAGNAANFSVTFSRTPHSSIRASAQKLLDLINIQFMSKGSTSRHIQITLDDYMRLQNLSDKKEARKKFKRDVDVLYDASISWTERTLKQEFGKPYSDVRLLSAKGSIDNSVIYINLTPEFVTVLSRYPKMAFPMSLLQTNDHKNPYTYLLGRTIRVHMRRNKCSVCYLKVETLLKAAAFPNEDETGRHYSERIKRPFERDMDAIEFIEWHYVDKDHKPVEGKDKASRDAISYETFKTLLVRITDTMTPRFESGLDLESSFLVLDGNT